MVIRYSHIVILTILWIACEAPRNNPLDPLNKDNVYHVIEGYVKTEDITHELIPNASLNWPLLNKQSFSDIDGFFSLELVGEKNGWLYCQKEGFYTDSVEVIWNGSNHKSVEFLLNSKATIDSINIYSIIQNRHGTIPIEEIVFEVFVYDREKDVDSVFIQIPFNDTRLPLLYNALEKVYQRKFSIYQLNESKSEKLLGQIVNIEVKEFFRRPLIPSFGNLKRVIRDEIKFISPANGITTHNRPELAWSKFEPGYDIQYSLEIYTFETFPQLVWSKTNLTQDSVSAIRDTLSYNVDTELIIDDYFWVIWATDEFGNRSRSKPASFRVE